MKTVRKIVVDFARTHRREAHTVWCGQHDLHPSECAEMHHPTAYRRNRR